MDLLEFAENANVRFFQRAKWCERPCAHLKAKPPSLLGWRLAGKMANEMELIACVLTLEDSLDFLVSSAFF